MPLMDRIKITSFLDMTYPERLSFITGVQTKRAAAIAKSKLAPVRKVRIGKHSSGKLKKVKDPMKEIKKLLAKLPKSQIAAIKASYGME